MPLTLPESCPTHPQPVDRDDGHPALRVGFDDHNPGRTVAAPDLHAAGYTLLGGRLVPTCLRSAALFVYGNRANQRIGVMVRPMIGIETDATMRAVSSESAAGYAWSRSAIGFSVVSSESQANLYISPIPSVRRRWRKTDHTPNLFAT